MHKHGWIAAFSLVVACHMVVGCKEGKVHSAGIEDITGDFRGEDGYFGDFRAGVDGVIPEDGAGPDGITEDLALTDEESGDGLNPEDGQLTPDLTGDSLEDGVSETTGPEELFAECSASQPCKSPIAVLCLLLPDSDTGICVPECGEGEEECPPWLECVQPDGSNPDLKVCLEIADQNELCDTIQGIICKSNYFCLAPPDGGKTMCTTFCTPGEGICQPGTTCTIMDSEDPTWGACLTIPDFTECDPDVDCKPGEVCVELVPDFARCAPACAEPDTACGSFGKCTELDTPAGAKANACLTWQEQGEICNPVKGMPCVTGTKCFDMGAPDGWDRCVAGCSGVPCDPGYVCKAPLEGAFPVCYPLEFAIADPIACNASFPCPNGELCLNEGDGGSGICIPNCDGGCPEGTECVDGGCLVVTGFGGSCLPQKGVACAPPAECLTDPGQQDSAGFCSRPCVPGGEPCPQQEGSCVTLSETESFCLQTADYGGLCSLDDGIGCAAGLTCIHIGNATDNGYCTPVCDGPGTCAQDVPEAVAECMLQQSGNWYCGFLCTGGISCPDGMTCAGFGMCTP